MKPLPVIRVIDATSMRRTTRGPVVRDAVAVQALALGACQFRWDVPDPSRTSVWLSPGSRCRPEPNAAAPSG
jgi:hypothetical protein